MAEVTAGWAGEEAGCNVSSDSAVPSKSRIPAAVYCQRREPRGLTRKVSSSSIAILLES